MDIIRRSYMLITSECYCFPENERWDWDTKTPNPLGTPVTLCLRIKNLVKIIQFKFTPTQEQTLIFISDEKHVLWKKQRNDVTIRKDIIKALYFVSDPTSLKLPLLKEVSEEEVLLVNWPFRASYLVFQNF